jgi:transcriptional regulator with XRE-family HTH domain
MSVLGTRLKQVRVNAGLSQERLGIEAGLDPMSASARMNRYEQGTRTPDPELVERIAAVLDVPAPFFYAADDEIASLIEAFGRLGPRHRSEVIELAISLLKAP